MGKTTQHFLMKVGHRVPKKIAYWLLIGLYARVFCAPEMESREITHEDLSFDLMLDYFDDRKGQTLLKANAH